MRTLVRPLAGIFTVSLPVLAGALIVEIGNPATDPEALATFYEKAFGMSETRRPANTPTFKEIVVNSGSTAEMAKNATSTPIVIATGGRSFPATMARHEARR